MSLLRRAGLKKKRGRVGHYLTNADLTTSTRFPAIEVMLGEKDKSVSVETADSAISLALAGGIYRARRLRERSDTRVLFHRPLDDRNAGLK
jgi:hypothetical protein